MIGKQKQLPSKRRTNVTFSTQKLILKRQKYHSENSDGVDHIKWKKYSLTIIILSGNLALTKRNYYTGSGCGNLFHKPHWQIFLFVKLIGKKMIKRL